jgi:hypothetical protein
MLPAMAARQVRRDWHRTSGTAAAWLPQADRAWATAAPQKKAKALSVLRTCLSSDQQRELALQVWRQKDSHSQAGTPALSVEQP